MSGIGILSDAHGNPWGLRAALAALRACGVESLFFLGDAVGYLPFGGEVLDILESEGAACVMGNHDAMLCGRLPVPPEADTVYGLTKQRGRLDAVQLDRISAWPDRIERTLGGRRVLMLHGGPRAPLTEYLYPDSDLTHLQDLPVDVVFTGHSHRPFIRRAGAVTVVNVGSCGLPRDQGNSAAACWFRPTEGGPSESGVEIIRVRFDVDAVLTAARDAQAPAAPQVAAVMRRGAPCNTGAADLDKK